jgi:hypothetical protein
MKKINIMLLSLALFAVVGGALAFKAKFSDTFCTTNAYFNAAGAYYCSFKPPGLPTTTTHCGPLVAINVTTDPFIGAIKNICTTNIQPDIPCEQLLCPGQVSVKPN